MAREPWGLAVDGRGRPPLQNLLGLVVECLVLQPKRFHGDLIRRVGAFFGAVYHAKAAAVVAAAEVPHVPADAVVLERRTHVVEPAGAVSRVRYAAVDAELITGE